MPAQDASAAPPAEAESPPVVAEEDATDGAPEELLPTLFQEDGAASGGRGTSSELSFKKTGKHFVIFFEEYCLNHPTEGKRIFNTDNPQHWTYNPLSMTMEQLSQLDVPVADHYAMYLATKAMRLDKVAEPLSYESASRYFSAFKCGVNHKLLYWKGPKPLMNDALMKKIRDGMTTIIAKRCIRNQQSLSKSHTSASFEDLKIIHIICIWKNDALSANLIFFLLALYYFSGRAYEIARLPFSRTHMHQPEEFCAEDSTSPDQVCETTIWRTKTNHETVVTVFNHRDNFLLDYYFAWAYSMLMCTTPTQYLFYKFMRHPPPPNATNAAPEADDHQPQDPAAPDQEAAADREAELDEEEPQERRAGSSEENDAIRSDNNVDPGAPLGSGAMSEANAKKSATLLDQEGNKITAFFNKCMTSLYAAGAFLDTLLDPLAAADPDSFSSNETGGSFLFNAKLSSHSPKRFAVNFIAGIPTIKTTWAVIAHGWQLKALSTIFDYLDFQKESTNQVAKAKAGWKIPNPWPGDNLGGGRPPSLLALKRKEQGDFGYDFAQAFSANLFEKYRFIEGANDANLQELLTSTVLMDLPKFVQLLREHPAQEFGSCETECLERHYFLQHICHKFELTCNARRVACPNKDEMAKQLFEWSNIISQDFIERNYVFVSEHQLRRLPEAQVTDDTSVADLGAVRGIRSIAGFLNGFGRALANANTTLYHIMVRLWNLCHVNAELRKEVSHLTGKVASLESKLDNVLQILEHNGAADGSRLPAKLRPSNVQRTPPPSHSYPVSDSDRASPVDTDTNSHSSSVAPRVSTSVSPAAHLLSLRDWTVSTIFVAWHTEQIYCYVPPKTAQGGAKQNRNAVKFCVEYLSLFLTEQLEPLPPDTLFGTDEASQYKAKLISITDAAWKRYCVFFASHNPAGPNAAVSHSVSTFKRFMEDLSPELWPDGPPGESPFQHPEVETKPESQQRMKTRAMLVANKVANAAKAAKALAKKRKLTQTTEPEATDQDPA